MKQLGWSVGRVDTPPLLTTVRHSHSSFPSTSSSPSLVRAHTLPSLRQRARTVCRRLHRRHVLFFFYIYFIFLSRCWC